VGPLHAMTRIASKKNVARARGMRLHNWPIFRAGQKQSDRKTKGKTYACEERRAPAFGAVIVPPNRPDGTKGRSPIPYLPVPHRAVLPARLQLSSGPCGKSMVTICYKDGWARAARAAWGRSEQVNSTRRNNARRGRAGFRFVCLR
jgi:hypothetical protein